jgi:hypothetical protein
MLSCLPLNLIKDDDRRICLFSRRPVDQNLCNRFIAQQLIRRGRVIMQRRGWILE